MDLRFEGDLHVFVGVAFSLLAAVVIYRVYRRETKHRAGVANALLPLLRAVTVAMIVMMLTGPVLRGSVNVADLSRVLVFVDRSKSMSLTDATMSVERKLLNARRLGLIDDDSIDTSLYDASQQLASIREPVSGNAGDETLRVYVRFILGAIDSLPESEPLKGVMRNELGDPIARIEEQRSDESLSDEDLQAQLAAIRTTAENWSARLGAEYRQRAGESSPSDSADAAAGDRMDEWTRWRRAEAVLLTDETALLPSLADQHRVDLFTISGEANEPKPQPLWQSRDLEDTFPETFEPVGPDGVKTDLATQIDSLVGELPNSQRVAVVLLSDGQHNKSHSGDELTSPVHLARLLGRRGVPLFPIGFGAASPPADLAVVAIQTPESVFADDRVKGEVLLTDHMPPGQSMRVEIRVEGQSVWSQTLTTTGEAARTIDFDFSIKELVENRLAGSLRDVESVSMPLPLTVRIDPIEGETRDDNNSRETSVRAITRSRRALLIAGRPRWEFRYLRNMLDRDGHWAVNHVLTLHENGRQLLPRGSGDGAFPTDREQLFRYDVVILGEVSVRAFTDQELDWLGQFVGSRGGGLMLIDGQRGKLRSYMNSSLNSLLPVRWTDDHRRGMRNARLTLAEHGRATSAFAMEGNAAESALLWSQLPRQSWVAPVESMPGCETLVTAHVGARTGPALVMRRFGAGTVLYSGFDESWRWRYEVSDEYHQRYWNQVANFVMESPYAIHDRFVSIDTGGFTYQPGESADLKVRFRDARGEPVIRQNAVAILYQDDQAVASIPLQGGASSGGVMRGTSQPLEPGSYRLGVEADGYDGHAGVRAEFVVVGDVSGELNALSCNEELMRQLAELSGGQYLREEDASRLPDLLAPFADGKEETEEFALWRSWYFFLPLLGLFTVEWFLRKKLGLM